MLALKRRFWLKENGGGDFWTADNKKEEKNKSMKKSAPPPQGRDAIFWKKIKVFLKWTTLALGDPQTFSSNRRPGSFGFENLRLLFGSTRALRAQDRALRARSIQRTQQSHATNARNARTQQTRSTPNKIRKHAKSRTTAENIAYRTNQLPVGAQDFAPTACNPTIIIE